MIMCSEQRSATNGSHDSPVIRRATQEDISGVRTLAAASPTAAHWADGAYDAYCSASWNVDAPLKVLFVAGIPSASSTSQLSLHKEASMIGFAAFTAIDSAGECELENMVVSEPWRRQGIGARLLHAGMLWCRAWCPSTATPRQDRMAHEISGVRLEVRVSNQSAIGFYERAGFSAVGRRARYYTQPEEDAVLMFKPLDSPTP